MRAIKGLILFCFLSVTISACFDAPEFNIIPEITFNKIKFKEVPGGGTNDSLILTINFRDGDGDLGINPDEVEAPFNNFFHYLADGTGDTTRVATGLVGAYTVIRTNGATGKLVTNRTRNEPNYGYLPLYDPNSCLNYSETQVLVREDDNIVDDSYNIIKDTLIGSVNYLIVREALLFKTNPNHYNIDVRFWYFEGGVYKEYDWVKEFCLTFNGRFKVLTDKGGPLEGTIRYSMLSTAFLAEFSIKSMKLSVKIRDRALHSSEEIYTPAFTLDGIR
jgi:hypothetical protein